MPAGHQQRAEVGVAEPELAHALRRSRRCCSVGYDELETRISCAVNITSTTCLNAVDVELAVLASGTS